MKPTATLQRIHPFLTVFLLLIFAGCGGGGGDGGSGACPPGVTCNGAGGGGGGGNSQVPTISIAPENGQNVLTLAPPTGSAATTFNVYWSFSPAVSITNGTPITGVSSPFSHTGLTNGTPIFYVVTAVSGASESTPSAVGGGMPGIWTALTPLGSAPTARDSHTAVYNSNSTSDKMIVFGGRAANGPLADLWILQNASTATPTWALSNASSQPAGRLGHTAVYNNVNNRMMTFGGAFDAFGSSLTDELRILSNADVLSSSQWSQPLALTSSRPVHRWGHASVYDQARDKMIVFGGTTTTNGSLTNEMWVLDLASTFTPSWRLITAVGAPSARCCMAVDYDAATRRMILYGGFGGFGLNGGTVLADLWTVTFNDIFTTATWQELKPAGGAALAASCCGVSLWDGSKLLLFGGGGISEPSSDNKIYAVVLQPSSSTFTAAVGPGGPPARIFPTAVPAGPFLLFGGKGASSPLNDLWRFN